MPVSELTLVVMVLAVGLLLLALGYVVSGRLGAVARDRNWEDQEVPRIKRKALKSQRKTLRGFFSEQLAPFLPDFPFRHTEARFIGKPVDSLVFNGLVRWEPEEVVFLEDKSGKAGLTAVERKLRDAVESKNESWFSCGVAEEIVG